MYRVFFSNGFDTVICWNGINEVLDPSTLWEIFDCWYPSRENVAIIKIVWCAA
jgi:hypothetical protein